MTAVDVRALVADLAEESAVIDFLLAPLPDADWLLATPAAGWTIADQVAHLAFFDDITVVSMTDPDRFGRESAELMAGGADFPDRVAEKHRHLSPAELLDWFAGSRAALLATYDDIDEAVRLPWFGTEMGVASSVTARLMETWAHGQDIADTLDVRRTPSSRLRHVADIGIRAIPYCYSSRGRPVPTDPVRVELAAPDGTLWTWGPADADDTVSGPALDFCLLATRRRHRDDTALRVSGTTAQEWMSIAQAYAGEPGPGRPPLGGPR